MTPPPYTPKNQDMDIDVDIDIAGSNSDDNCVFLLSLHQESNFPPTKIKSHIDVPLDDNTKDEEYLQKLATALKQIPVKAPVNDNEKTEFEKNLKFDLCIYVAGADPYVNDPLGGIDLSLEGLRKRDAMVAKFCFENKIPISVVLAGGYADAEEVAQIHYGTFEEVWKVYGSKRL